MRGMQLMMMELSSREKRVCTPLYTLSSHNQESFVKQALGCCATWMVESRSLGYQKRQETPVVDIDC